MIKKTTSLFLFLFIIQCIRSQGVYDTSVINVKAPERFNAIFKTTKGEFIMEATRSWSPEGVDRLYQLITSGFFKDIGIFRVQRGYVVQFGISDNQAINRFWDKHPIKDEPVSISNLRGYISFARDGVETRTTQLFINLNDNLKLDTVNYNGLRGFPPVARIIKGFTTVESFYSGYGFEPANHQDSVLMYGNSYLKKKFPEIDYILEARIIKN